MGLAHVSPRGFQSHMIVLSRSDIGVARWHFIGPGKVAIPFAARYMPYKINISGRSAPSLHGKPQRARVFLFEAAAHICALPRFTRDQSHLCVFDRLRVAVEQAHPVEPTSSKLHHAVVHVRFFNKAPAGPEHESQGTPAVENAGNCHADPAGQPCRREETEPPVRP